MTTEASCSEPVRHGAAADRTYRFLARLGFQPVHYDRGARFPAVGFVADGLGFRIQLDEEDESFWQVALGFRFAPPRRPDLEVLRSAHDAQAGMKVVKIRVWDDQAFVEFLAPVLLQGRRPTLALLRRCMALLRETADEFHERLLLVHPVGRA